MKFSIRVNFNKNVGIMMRKPFIWIVVMVTIVVLGTSVVSAVDKNSEALSGIPPRIVADYLHAVIMAHRNFYTIHIVNPLLQEGIVDVSEN
jgi:hypothetical protein